ncbi:MAG: Asp-tRNA(Asn)/Glu-tRNA(Gln) amidotransferase subunit GatC [Bacteroidota bacterium]
MLSRQEIDHVARLARLNLTEEERAVYTNQLNEILGYVDKLKELDVTGVEPTAHAVPLQNILRPDESRPSFDREDMLANAPERREGYVKVPKILEGQV